MYSQNNEEQIVKEYFDRYYPNLTGTVLDIGANDGKTLSNSRALISELDWHAVLIEAARTPFTALQELYKDNKDVVCHNLAICNEDGQLQFYESGHHLGRTDVGLVSSLVPSETERWKKAGVKYTEYTVEARTWTALCSENYPNEIFDFITIDIEGLDYDVLTQINLSAHGCKCLCVEWNGKDKEKFSSYAFKHGLTLINENPENLIFAKLN